MKIIIGIFIIMMASSITFTCVCLIKYLRFDKRMKEANQKQNEKDINQLNLN